LFIFFYHDLSDAAHVMAPNLAQGAALAIEDALQLASSFSMTNEPRAALREFSRVRIKRVHLVQRLVKAEHWVGSCDGFSAWLRNLLFWVPTFVKTPVFDSTHRWALGWSYSPPPLPRIGLYERVLGPKAFARLDQRVRHLHGGVESVMIRGEAKVISSWLARLFFGFKTYTGPFVLECTRDSRLESWKRRFGDFVFETQQFSAEGQLIESFGPLQFAFDLVPAGGGFKHVLSRLSIGKWIPLPKVISIDATTSEENKIFCGDVKVSLLGKWVLLKYNVRV
jgi:hypothetical protein